MYPEEIDKRVDRDKANYDIVAESNLQKYKSTNRLPCLITEYDRRCPISAQGL